MVDRADELKETAAQCLALAHTTSDPQTRAALLTMAQKLYERANTPPADYEAAQRAFNDQQMLPRSPMQQPASLVKIWPIARHFGRLTPPATLASESGHET